MSTPHDVAARLLALAGRKEAAVIATVRLHALLLETRVKANASGRPGPRVITGDYRRSINSQFEHTATSYGGTVGTNAPQARRLENGFVGPDRLGRVYNQPPFPHFAPALTSIRPQFERGLALALATP